MKRLDDTIKELEYCRTAIQSGCNVVSLSPAINNLLALKEEIEEEISDSYSRGVEAGREAGYYEGRDG